MEGGGEVEMVGREGAGWGRGGGERVGEEGVGGWSLVLIGIWMNLQMLRGSEGMVCNSICWHGSAQYVVLFFYSLVIGLATSSLTLLICCGAMKLFN